MHLTPAQVLTMTFHFVPFRPAKGWQPRNLLQVRDVLRVMLISCRAGYENPASCHPGFRRLKDFGQAIHQLQPGHVSIGELLFQCCLVVFLSQCLSCQHVHF